MGDEAEAARELQEACLGLALAIKAVDAPVASDSVRVLSREYERIGRELLSDELRVDERLLAGAVNYLKVHAIPPVGDDTAWFRYMMQAVVEIARPNSGVDDEGRAFLKEMREGINSLLDD